MKEDINELKRKLKNLREKNRLLRKQIGYLEQLNDELTDKYHNVNQKMMYLKELQNSKNKAWGRIKQPGEVMPLGPGIVRCEKGSQLEKPES